MNIGQNLLDAFDIVLDKKLSDAFSNTPQIIVAEISDTDIFANTYTVKYQGSKYSGVISNNNIVYSLGDIVQVLTDNSNYIIIGRLSSSGGQALYNNYLAQLSFDKETINELINSDQQANITEFVLYSRSGDIYRGVTRAAVDAINDALQKATRVTCKASAVFNLLENAPESETCSIEVIVNSIAYSIDKNGENKEDIKASKKIVLNFNDLQNHLQQTQNQLTNLHVTEGLWTLETVTLKRSSTLVGATIKEFYITVESDKLSLADSMTMIINSEKTVFEQTDPVDQLTQTVKITNPSGGYFYTPGLRYLWGAEEPTIVLQDTVRYNAFLGEGWAHIGNTNSNSFNISITDVPTSSRRFKCVAIIEEDSIVASGIVEITNAKLPHNVSDLIVEYPSDRDNIVTVTAEENTQCYWVQRTQKSELVAFTQDTDNTIDIINSTVNFADIIICSMYDAKGEYIGSKSGYIFSDSANANSAIAGEIKRWIVVKDRATDAPYFDEKIEEWYKTPEIAYKHAYNGRDGATRTYIDADKIKHENVNALKDLNSIQQFKIDEDGNVLLPFGYYLWRQTSVVLDNGVASTYRQLESPLELWKKEVQNVTAYYIVTEGSTEPEKPVVQPIEHNTDDGHSYKTWGLDLAGWTEDSNTVKVSAELPRKWQVLVTTYTDGSKIVGEQLSLVDIYNETVATDVIIQKIEIDNSSLLTNEVIINITYQDSVPHYGKYVFQTSKYWGTNSIQGFNEILVAWSDTNETAPGDEYFYNLTDDFFDTQPQNAYLWAKLTPSFSGINDEQNTSSTKLVIATTLGLARIFQSSTTSYSVGTKDHAPSAGWDTDFEVVAKKLDNINNYIWTATKTEYQVFLITEEYGADWIELSPSKDEGTSRVLSWAAENDRTFIDGAKIYTGSIKADALDVTKLDAIAANIAGWNINSNSLSKDTTFLSAGSYSPNEDGIYQRIAIGGEAAAKNDVEQEFVLENLPIETGIDDNTQEEINFFSFSIVSSTQPENVKCVEITYITNEGQVGTLNDITLSKKAVSQINEARWQCKVNVDVTRVKLIKEVTVEYTVQEVPGLYNPVFEVLSDGSMNATKGHISGWTIKNLKEVTVKDKPLPDIGVIYYDNKTYSVGLAEVHMSTSTGTPLATDPVFWAGYESSRGGAGSTPWENNSDETRYSWSSLTPFYVTGEGGVYATKGEIAGWTIGPVTGGLSGFYSRPSSNPGAGIAQVNYSQPSDPVFWAGYTGSGNTPWENNSTASGHDWSYYTPFYVTGQGGIYATNAHFSGNSSVEGRIIATSGSLKDLDLTGTLTFGSAGSIVQKSNNVQVCRWNDQGIIIFKGIVGPWSILTERGMTPGEPNNTYLQAVYYGTTDSGSSDFNKPIYAYLQHDRLATWNQYTNTTSSVLWENITTYFENLYSDQKLKNNIENFTEPYEEFFDALQPKRYKYIAGTSGRYHTGFIAQEVVAGLKKAGLSTQDFAAVTFGNTSAGNCWQLRRDEFISLNTWQIQKLKARVTELENKLNELLK